MRSTALVMGVVMLAVAFGTYFALGYVPPGVIPGVGIKVEEADRIVVEPIKVASANRAPTAQEPSDGDGMEAGDEMADPDSEADSGSNGAKPTTGAAGYASSEEIERALANEPPPEEGMVDASARPAQPAEPDDEPEAEPTPPAPKAAAKAPKPEPKPAAKPAPATETASASKPQPAPKPANADALKQWWPNPDSLPANQLKLVYAGPVKGQAAIAVLFSDALDLASLNANAKIKTSDGSVVAGEWKVGKNPRLAMFDGLAPGRYTVVLGPTIAGGGFMLGRTLQGPVYVKEP